MIRSTFFGFEAAKTAVFANQKSLDIVGHNLANSETNGYTRQRVDRASKYVSSYSSRIGSSTIGQAGRGVETLGVSQMRDSFLDKCFRDEYSLSSSYSKKTEILNDIVNVIPEANDITDSSGLIGGIEKIYQGLNKYCNSPTFQTEANIVKSSFTNIAQVLNQMDERLDVVASRQTEDLQSVVNRTNDVLEQIAHINKVIAGDSTVAMNPDNEYFRPNELVDKRNLLLDELAGYGDVNVQDKADGTITVEMGGKQVVSGKKCDSLNLTKNEKGYVNVTWRTSGERVDLSGGSISAYVNVLNGRGYNVQSGDETDMQGIPYYRDRINTFAAALANVANTTIPNGKDSDGNPNKEFKILLAARTPDGNTSNDEPITAANISISDDWTNGGAGYFIYSTEENVEDYAQLLSTRLCENNNNFVSYGESYSGTFSEYTIDFVSKLGSDVNFNESKRDATAVVADDFISSRDCVSGVQQDEETANMLKYQKSYEAAARVMTVMDDLLETLINRVGRAGL